MLDAYLIEGEALMVARPRGVFDLNLAEQLIEFVETKETELEAGFNRFCDLNYLEGVPLSFTDVMKLAGRRSTFNPNKVRVRSAFLAADPIAYAVIGMYERLLDNSRIEVRVFKELEAAAKWLGVKPETLRP
ncbi:MAG: hypothetical protein ABSD20_04780 [Terriglobales bacterium]|jgi:hypothetical protein